MIRIPVKNDIPNLINLINQLGYKLSFTEMEYKLNIYNTSENYALFIFEINNKVIGLIALSFIEMLVNNFKRCRIEALIIDENFRNNGYGKILIKHAEDIAKSKNSYVIELTSGSKRAISGAHNFYKNLGYMLENESNKIYFRKILKI